MIPELRKFPYPYRAALAICNDCALMSPDDFREIHVFLNTHESTPFGDGLGLDIGDSVFWYNNNPYETDQLAYANLKGRPLPNAGFIREAIAEGWIDCLYTWGDFSHRGGFARRHAEMAAGEMDKRGIRLRVWLNHGDIHNFQNIASTHLESLGDLPKATTPDGKTYPVWEYHTDITTAAGVRYFWNNTLTGILGQERPLSRSAYYRQLMPGGRAALASFAHAVGSIFPNYSKSSFPAKAAKLTVEYAGFTPYDGNDLLIPHVLRDGRRVCRFRRWGDWKNDTVDVLAERLSPENLGLLLRREGYAITYAHFGRRKNKSGLLLPLLPGPVVAALKRLKAESESRIWVARTSRLLDYNRAWHAVGGPAIYREGSYGLGAAPASEKTLHLAYDPTSDPLSPDRLISAEKAAAGPLTAEELAGLTWYFDGDRPPRVLYRDREVAFTENPPDYTGLRSLTLTGKNRE